MEERFFEKTHQVIYEGIINKHEDGKTHSMAIDVLPHCLQCKLENEKILDNHPVGTKMPMHYICEHSGNQVPAEFWFSVKEIVPDARGSYLMYWQERKEKSENLPAYMDILDERFGNVLQTIVIPQEIPNSQTPPQKPYILEGA